MTFVLFNWKFFYVLLVSSHVEGSYRIFLAQEEFLNRSTLGFEWGGFWFIQFFLPLAVTILGIELLPRLNNIAYERFLSHEKERLVAKSERDRDVAKTIADNKAEEAASLTSIEKSEEVIEEKKEALPNEIAWGSEFDSLSQRDKVNLEDLIQFITFRGGNQEHLSQFRDAVEFGVKNNLITHNKRDRYVYTQKGQYFSLLNK